MLRQTTEWAERVAREHPGLERIGVFGSHGRGDAGVGSDLDLLLIDRDAAGPQHQRLLACGSAMGAALARDSRWLWPNRPRPA